MLRNPEFIIYCGPMFSTKTSHLLTTLDRYSYQQKRVIAFKPRMDDRYSKSDIVTHGGHKMPALLVSTGDEIIRKILDEKLEFDVIAVDEAFMIDGIADVLISLYKLGKTVVVSSLEMSASCNPFEEIVAMMPWATMIEKCTAVCVVCRDDAHFTQRKTQQTDEILVGGSDMYEPRCWRCHENVNQVIE